MIDAGQATPTPTQPGTPTPLAIPPRVDLVMQPAPPAVQPLDRWSLVGPLAWPLTVVIVVIVLRKGIADALRGLAARASKFSVGVIAIELAQSSARSPGPLDEIRDATSAAVADSSGALFASLLERTPADYASIDLGNGREWLTSRLFAVATFVARQRGLRAVVFSVADQRGPRVLGTASIDAVRRALGAQYPWLELAYAEAWSAAAGLPARNVERMNAPRTIGFDPADPKTVAATLARFIAALTDYTGTPGSSEWESLQAAPPRMERAQWVTDALVKELLGSALARDSVVKDLDTSQDQLAHRVMRAEGDVVAVVDGHGTFRGMLNRRQFIDRTARSLADNG